MNFDEKRKHGLRLIEAKVKFISSFDEKIYTAIDALPSTLTFPMTLTVLFTDHQTIYYICM